MPPVSPVAERASRVRFRRAMSLMAMTLVAPGSAQLVAGNRTVGRIAIRIWLALLAILAVTGLVVLLHHQAAFTLASNTKLLFVLRFGLILLAIGWAYLFFDAWRLGSPLSLGMRQRRWAVGVNGALALSVAGGLLFSSHVVAVQRDLIQSMFGETTVRGAHDGRFNVLLLGGDSGAGRWGLRPDSMTVASIDARTGKTVLVSLPRNLENFRFADGSVMDKQFPKGFDCEGCYLNGVSTWAEDHTELFGKSKTPGVDATIQAIEGITDLKINYWAMVNLEGFKDLVDAVGGVTLNVRDRIPVGGLGSDVYDYIEPGEQKLNGFETLWFARAREGSDDYSRMARQKCVMNAMLQQVSPQTVMTNFTDIASASKNLVSTDLPASEVDTFMDLALKAKNQEMSTVSLVPPMIDTADPDLELMRDKVAEAIDRAEGEGPADSGKKKAKRAKVTSGGSIGTRDTGYAANDSADLGAVC